MKQLVPHFVLALVALGDIRELDVEAGLLRVYEVRRITALLSAVTGYLYIFHKTKVYGESKPIAYEPFRTPNFAVENTVRNGVRYNLAGGKDLKAILILHEYVAYILFPLIIFLGYHFFPFFVRVIFGCALEEEDMEMF